MTVSTTHRPATDLGFLLHKHPERVQSFPVSAGTAHVFYPEAGAARTTAALLLEVDPIGLVRRRGGAQSLGHHVNDRPYAASSLLAVALRAVFGTALGGTCHARPELAATPIPLEITIPALPCRGGPDLPGRLFAPLGWQVDGAPLGDGTHYVAVTLTGTLRLADALRHLYVLLPVLDGAKHYWVDDTEVDKLLRAGGEWLAAHPERTLITRRYLAHQARMVDAALARLAEVDDTEPEALDTALAEALTPQPSLAVQRRAAVLAELRDAGARRVLDLGCGEGLLLRDLLALDTVTEVVGVDVSPRALAAAERGLQRRPDSQRAQVTLRQSSLTYRDAALTGYDAAVLMEVIEHLDESRLPALTRVLFGHTRPSTVIVTTPNVEHNVRYGIPDGARRHPDHRFEWTREQFRTWCGDAAAEYGYRVRFVPVGPDDPEVGAPTQLAVFTAVADA